MTPAETSLADIIIWAVGLSTLMSLTSMVWTIFSGPARRNASKLDEHQQRMDRMDGRISSVEQTLRSLPGKEDIHLVQIALTEMRGDLRTMQASMSGNNEIMKRLEIIVTRHEDHLLTGNKR